MLNYNNEEYFRRLPGGGLANTSEDMMVTIKGCEEFCGTGTFYWDAGPRITTWIVPVVLLMSNIELSPIDKRRFITVRMLNLCYITEKDSFHAADDTRHWRSY